MTARRNSFDDYAILAVSLGLAAVFLYAGFGKIGDTLQVKFKVREARVSKSIPAMGILFIEMQLTNQRDEVVQEGEHRLMVPRRPELVGQEMPA